MLAVSAATVLAAESNTLLKGLDSSTTSRDGSVGSESKQIYDDATQKLAMCDDPQAVWIALYMAQCHHFLGTESFKADPKVALDHYFSAYRLAVVRCICSLSTSCRVMLLSLTCVYQSQAAHRKQSASNLKSLSSLGASRRAGNDGPSEDGLKRALTTCVKSVTVLQAAAGFGEGEQSLLQTCDEFKTIECLHIAHALVSTGNSALSQTWINNAMRDMTDVFASAAKREAEIVR
jgi:hypothetical protein